MNQPTPRNDRFTAIASTLVAIAILAAGVTAQQSPQANQNELTRLESDLRFQLERAFKHDGSRRSKRMAQVDQVLRDWQDSQKTEQDRARLTAWLTEATANSVPGSNLPFPLAPVFSQPPQPVQQATKDSIPANGQEATLKPTTKALVAFPTETIVISEQFPTVPPVGNQQHAPQPPTENIAPPTITAAKPVIETIPTSALPDTTQSTIQPAALQTTAKTDSVPVHINLVELAARIAGYHHSLDAVETQLLTHQNPSLGTLARQLEQLDPLTRDFHFVNLYYEALTEKQQRTITAPRSMAATLKEINRHLTRQEKHQHSDFLSTFETTPNQKLTTLRTHLITLQNNITQ